MSSYPYSITPVPLGVSMAPDGSTLFNQYNNPEDSESQKSFQYYNQLNYLNFMTNNDYSPPETEDQQLENM